MEWEKYLANSQFIYIDVTSEEIATLTQDHYFTEVNGIKAIGVGNEIEELNQKKYSIITI